MAITLELAISAIRAGRKAEGRQLLNLLIQKNPNDPQAWLWMSSVVDSDKQRARCLYHVLSIEPESKLARRGLKILGVEVSDTRPVKINTALLQPAQLPPPAANDKNAAATSAPKALPQPAAETQAQDEPQPQSAAAESKARGPFLIDPQRMTEELPFTPLRPPFSAAEPIQASPAILSIDVEKVGVEESDAEKVEATNGHHPEISPFASAAATQPKPVSEETATASEELPVEAPAENSAQLGDNAAPVPSAAVATEEKIEIAGPDSPKDAAAPSTKTETTAPEPEPNASPGPFKTQRLPSLIDVLYGNKPQTAASQQQKAAGSGSDQVPSQPESPPDPRSVETQKLQEDTPSTPQKTITRPTQPATATASLVASDPQGQQPSVAGQPEPPSPAVAPNLAASEPAPPPAAESSPAQTQGSPTPASAPQQTPSANSPGAVPGTGSPPAANGAGPEQAQQSLPPNHQGPQQPQNNVSGPNPPMETRPAQPILTNYPPPNPTPPPNPGPSPHQQAYYYGGQQSPGQPNQTAPMPNPNPQQPYPQPPYPQQGHPPANMGAHPQQNDYYRPPSEPVPVHAMGLVPYGYNFQHGPPGSGLHSNATVLMPNLSEAEIRARLATSQAIPTANAAAMPLQNVSGWPGAPHAWYGQRPEQQEYYDDQDEDADEGVNVLAVIIFGTLSVTALGGLGMLILLILTTSPPTA